MYYFDKHFIRKLNNEKYLFKNVVGANLEDINRIEEYFNIKLPKAYVEFLLIFGNGGGNIMKGSSVFLDE